MFIEHGNVLLRNDSIRKTNRNFSIRKLFCRNYLEEFLKITGSNRNFLLGNLKSFGFCDIEELFSKLLIIWKKFYYIFKKLNKNKS